MTCYVLVHGGFTDGWYWGETATLLEKEGHRVHVAELPSTGREPVGLGGLAEDAAEVRRLVAAAGEPVVLVGHSYGGMVVTELADDPGVAHTVYVSAFWPARGQAVMELVTSGGGVIDWIVPSEDGSAVRVTDDVDAAHAALCADLQPARVPEWYAGLMWSGGGALGGTSSAPDRGHPTTYVVLEQDRAIPAALQESMATGADHVERLDTAHIPQLTDAAGLAAALARAGTR